MRTFKVVDVFTTTSFQGNPVAVVLKADGLSDAEMQKIAAWTNLSETTFHLSPTNEQADYRLRIFTPRSELPFAGHPTLGSAHALIEAGIVTPRDGCVVQECGAGFVPIMLETSDGTRVLRLQLPQAEIRDLTGQEKDRLVSILGRPLAEGVFPALVDVGARWIVAEFPDAETVLALEPDLAASAVFEKELNLTGVTVFGRYASGSAEMEVRSFAPSCGVNEDPVCGSGNGSIAACLLRNNKLPDGATYVATQGQCVGRSGRVSVQIAGGQVFVGGTAVTTINGMIAV